MIRPTEYRCTVKSKRQLTPTVFELTFETDASFAFLPGQFISLVVPGAGPKGSDLRRAYSIASSPGTFPIELCIKSEDLGPGTRYLASLKPGSVFRAFSPYGSFIFHPKPGRRACFVATGTGLAPYRSMVLSESFLTSLPVSTLCILGVREESEILYDDDFKRLPFLHWEVYVSRPKSPNWTGRVGRVTDHFRLLGDSFPWLETEFYLCGNGAMIKEMRLILNDRGVARASIHQEIYFTPKPGAVAPG